VHKFPTKKKHFITPAQLAWILKYMSKRQIHMLKSTMVKWLILKVIIFSTKSPRKLFSTKCISRTLFHILPHQGDLRKIKLYPTIQLEPSMP
jgi:hypothetical protein